MIWLPGYYIAMVLRLKYIYFGALNIQFSIMQILKIQNACKLDKGKAQEIRMETQRLLRVAT